MKTRMHCVEINIQSDLSINYRLTLPVKTDHLHLFTDQTKIQSYIQKGKIRHHFVHESDNRFEILRIMTSAQAIINEQKIKELQQKQEALLSNLSSLKQ